MNHLGLLVLLAVSLDAASAPVVTITCHEPLGQRRTYGVQLNERNLNPSVNPHFVMSEDGYTGTHPIFIIDSANQKIMTFVWGDTILAEPGKKAARDLGVTVPATSAKEATLIKFERDEIIALYSTGTPGSGLSMFSFFPKLGIGYFSDQWYNPIFDWAEQRSLSAQCEFSWADGK